VFLSVDGEYAVDLGKRGGEAAHLDHERGPVVARRDPQDQVAVVEVVMGLGDLLAVAPELGDAIRRLLGADREGLDFTHGWSPN
jgi:hypothetical protein